MQQGDDSNLTTGRLNAFAITHAHDSGGTRLQASHVRELVMNAQHGSTHSDADTPSLQMHVAFYSIPKIEGEGQGGYGKSCMATGQRGMMTRTGDRNVTQVFLFSGANTEALRQMAREPVERKKEVWAETMKGSGWQIDRFLRELKTCTDFYDCELAQVKLKQIYNGP